MNHSTKTRGPVPFAVTTPTDAIDKTPPISMLESGVGASSSKTTSNLYVGATRKNWPPCMAMAGSRGRCLPTQLSLHAIRAETPTHALQAELVLRFAVLFILTLLMH